MNDQTITLPVGLVQAIVNYLSDRPFREVAALISQIMDATKKESELSADSAAN